MGDSLFAAKFMFSYFTHPNFYLKCAKYLHQRKFISICCYLNTNKMHFKHNFTFYIPFFGPTLPYHQLPPEVKLLKL